MSPLVQEEKGRKECALVRTVTLLGPAWAEGGYHGRCADFTYILQNIGDRFYMKLLF